MSKQKAMNTWETTKFMVSFIWNRDRKYIFIKFIFDALNALFVIPNILLPGLIINELSARHNLQVIFIYLLGILLAPLLQTIINSATRTYLNKLKREVDLKVKIYYLNILADMDYELWEKPTVQEMKGRAEETIYDSMRIIDQISGLISSVFTMITVASIVTTLNPLILVLILLLVLINSQIGKILNKKQYEKDVEIGKNIRRCDTVESVFQTQFYAKELRLYNLKVWLFDKYTKANEKINKLFAQKDKTTNRFGIYYALTNLIQTLAIYAYLVYMVLKRSLPIGNFTIYMTATNKFSSALNAVANSYNSIAANTLKISDLIEFLNIPMRQMNTKRLKPTFDRDSVIEFIDVSFKYPGSNTYALKNINLKIYGNQKLCIVGENGAGKSTFIKLLTRLYFPNEGRILLNGIDINQFDYNEYQRLFTAAFQDCAMYHLTLRENITVNSEYDEEKLNTIVEQTKLAHLVKKLPKGLDTRMYKYETEDGFEPSGGEEQRIAIARAWYRGGNIFLLDEPTAALDPLAEHEIYMQFANMITDKCAVLITHRLSAVQLVDKVAVFDDGRIAEYGTHAELYAKGGIYTEMFDKQAQFYRDEAPATENVQGQ